MTYPHRFGIILFMAQLNICVPAPKDPELERWLLFTDRADRLKGLGEHPVGPPEDFINPTILDFSLITPRLDFSGLYRRLPDLEAPEAAWLEYAQGGEPRETGTSEAAGQQPMRNVGGVALTPLVER